MAGSTLPYYRGAHRQRGRGIGALAATLGRVGIPFATNFLVPAAKRLGKNVIIPTAKRIGRDVLEFAAPDIGDVITGKKKVKSFAKDVGAKTIRKQLGGGKRKKNKRLRVSKRKTSVRNSRSRSDFFGNIPE